MSQVEEAVPETLAALPGSLPILPLRDTVVFPESMTPLAIGQERSIRLVDEAVAPPRGTPSARATSTTSVPPRSSTR